MSNLTKIPQQDGFRTNLAQSYSGGLGTLFLQSAPAFTMPVGETCYVVVQPNGANPFLAEFDNIDTGNNTINITNVTLFKGAGIANPTGITYPTNTEVLISDNYQFWSDIKDAINSKLDSGGTNTTTTWDLQVSGSAFRIRLDAGDMKFTDDNNVEISLSTIAAAAGADRKVAVSSNDTTPGQLDAKIIAGDGIDSSILNPSADEDLQIAIDLITTNGLKFVGGQLDVNASDTSNIGTVVRATDTEALAITDETKYINPKQISPQGLTASTNIQISANTERSSDTNNVWVKKKEVKINGYIGGGTIKVYFDLKSDQIGVGGTGDSSGAIYVNGAQVGTTRTVNNQAGYSTFEEDITVSNGDLVQLYIRDNDPATAFCRNFQIGYDVSYLAKEVVILD